MAGCGGSGGGPTPEDEAILTAGRVYPAVAGLVLVEYDTGGAELQRSAATASDGSFQFTRRLHGARVEALYTPSPDHVEPVFSTRLGNAPAGAPLEITPLTTWFDQLLVGGRASATSVRDIQALVATNCPALAGTLDPNALYASSALPAADHDWLLQAAAAYLHAARKLGLGPKEDFAGWATALGAHADTLSQLCAFSATVSAPAWSAAQADRLTREAGVLTIDAARLADAIDKARSQGLNMLAKQIQESEFPGQTSVLQAANVVAGRELSLSSDYVMAHYQLARPADAAAADQAVVASSTSVAITSAGAVVTTLQGNTDTAGAAVPAMRLTNDGTADKTVRLAIDGQEMLDLPGVIEHVVALPVAYPGEPLYRKAWRYLMAHKRNTQQLAISFFQYQPDLWLRSVGSSYCEAQASALFRIWRAMGYEARVYGLTGHVTVEIFIDGRWQIFDPFLGVYYTDRQGQIVGVAELQQDPTLITNPQTPLLPLTADAYSSVVAKVFATTTNNGVATGYMTTEPEPMDNVFQVPAGGYLEVNAATDVALDAVKAGFQVDMSTMSLWVPPGYTGTIQLPLVLLDIEGTGSVQLFGRSINSAGVVVSNRGLAGLGSLDTSSAGPGIHALLQQFYFHATTDIGVTEVKVNSSGPGGLMFTLQVNPLYFDSQQRLTVRASGADLQGLRFAASPAAAASSP